jgi:uncharacterized phage protein gp47/JayE
MYEDVYFTKPTGEIVNLSDIINDLLEIEKQAQFEGLNKVTDYTPGSQAYHVIYQQALIIFEQLQRINESELNSLPFNMKGEYLDYVGNSIGVHRDGATNSSGVIVIALANATTEDILLSEGSIVSTQDAITFLLDEDTAIEKDTSSTSVKVVCSLSGTVGNVNANTITEMITRYDYDFIITNPNAFNDGTDEEEDEAYLERIIAAPDSYPPGSKGWYESIANSLSNVHDTYFINMPGEQAATVELVINCNNKTESSTTISELATKFNEDRFNIGGIYLILTPVTEIPVFADNLIHILLSPNYTFSAVKNEVINVITNYFNGRNSGQEYDTDCIKFLIGNTPGVAAVTITDTEKIECTVYEVFTTDFTTLASRITEVTI